MTVTILTQEIIRELIHYDPDTGVFTWLERDSKWFPGENYCRSWNTQHAEKITGTRNTIGYIVIRIFDTLYSAHRLACLYMDGHFPPHETDHISGVRSDNRWSNLRNVTATENRKNQVTPKHNTSGHIGVCWNKRDSNWHSQIGVDGRGFFLGYFESFDDAAAARKAAEVKHGFHPHHGRAA